MNKFVADAEIVELRLLANHANKELNTKLTTEGTSTGCDIRDGDGKLKVSAYGVNAYWEAQYYCLATPELILRMIETITNMERHIDDLRDMTIAEETANERLNAYNAILCDDLYRYKEQAEELRQRCTEMTTRLAKTTANNVIALPDKNS